MNLEDIEMLIDTHGKSVFSFCMKLTLNKEDAEDLYQQTFLKALELNKKINKYNNPKSFLISIAINLWKNLKRKYARHQRIAPLVYVDEPNTHEVADSINIENDAINKELKAELLDSVNNLNDKLRIPILLYYNSELSIEEIALALKIPKGTVKSRLHKGRLIIKKDLEAKGYEGYEECRFSSKGYSFIL